MIKPEWYAAIQQITYKDWDYNLIGAIDGDYLQITFVTYEWESERYLWCERNESAASAHGHNSECYTDVPVRKPVTQFCRKWRLENGYTVSDIVKVAFMATLAAEEHETREAFKYKEVSVFGPHLDVDALVDLAKLKKNLDLREEVMA